MAFSISAGLLDAMVLAIVNNEDTYGYKITQEVRNAMEVSESTLYPVLRRLQKDSLLEIYDMPYMGRNRRYYKITQKGVKTLEVFRYEWQDYKNKIDNIILVGGAQ